MNRLPGTTRRRLPAATLLALLAAASFGCAPTATLMVPNIPPWNGPKARIAVARFDYKAAKGRSEVGSGLSTMLTTELVNSGRFIVLERETLEDVLGEQDLGTAGRISKATAAPVGEVEGAEILVMGAVTAFEPNKMGLGGMLLGGATLIGSALISSNNRGRMPVGAVTYLESYLAMDVRLVDTATSRVLTSLSVEGKSVDYGGGLMGSIGGGRSTMPLAFGGFQKTSVEKAMRVAIARAVEGVVAKMPQEFYRHAADTLLDGELMGYSYLDTPPGAKPVSAARRAQWVESPQQLDALMKEWGVGPVPAAAAVNFNEEILLAAIGSGDDRGGALSIQKIVNDPRSVRVEIGVLPPPPSPPAKEQPPAQPAKNTADKANIQEKPKEEPQIPCFVARTSRLNKPLAAQWIEAPAAPPAK